MTFKSCAAVAEESRTRVIKAGRYLIFMVLGCSRLMSDGKKATDECGGVLGNPPKQFRVFCVGSQKGRRAVKRFLSLLMLRMRAAGELLQEGVALVLKFLFYSDFRRVIAINGGVLDRSEEPFLDGLGGPFVFADLF